MENQRIQTEGEWPGQYGRDRLKNIDILRFGKEQQISVKTAAFMEQSQDQPYAHYNEGYVVTVTFNGEADATDVMVHYLKKRTEFFHEYL